MAPIIRELILKQQPEKTKAYVEPWLMVKAPGACAVASEGAALPAQDRICSWNFVRAVPAHFDCPIQISPKQFREIFSFASNAGNDRIRLLSLMPTEQSAP